MTDRPTRYPPRQPAPPDVAASLAFQAPAPEPMSVPVPTLAPAFPGLPEGPSARLDDERDRLLRRILGAQVPHRSLALLLVEAEGLGCFTDAALRRMVKVLDVILGGEA